MTGWVVGAGPAYNHVSDIVIQPITETKPSTNKDILDERERVTIVADGFDLDSEPGEDGNGLQGIGAMVRDSFDFIEGNMSSDFQFVKRPSDSVGSFKPVRIDSLGCRNAVPGKWSDESR